MLIIVDDHMLWVLLSIKHGLYLVFVAVNEVIRPFAIRMRCDPDRTDIAVHGRRRDMVEIPFETPIIRGVDVSREVSSRKNWICGDARATIVPGSAAVSDTDPVRRMRYVYATEEDILLPMKIGRKAEAVLYADLQMIALHSIDGSKWGLIVANKHRAPIPAVCKRQCPSSIHSVA